MTACKEKVCAWCGLVFVPNRGGQKYCCEHCKHEAEKERYRLRNQTAGGPRKKAGKKQEGQPKELPLPMKEDAQMRDPFSERPAMNMPERFPQPRCKLERDVLEARKVGAKSYGYFMAGIY